MRDIFNGYNTGDREWTFSRKSFTEHDFRQIFFRVLPNDILHDAALAFLHVDRIDVMIFSVPMDVPEHSRNLRRNVLFIQRPDSDYWTMFSFMWRQRPGVVGGIVQAFAENAHTGNMSEYDILDMVEPMNEGHQGALMETWFDIDNTTTTTTATGSEMGCAHACRQQHQQRQHLEQCDSSSTASKHRLKPVAIRLKPVAIAFATG
jgi:hypothetical protein